MACEMCGSKAPIFKSRIEGSVLDVCKECSEYGTIVAVIEPEKKEKQAKKEKRKSETNLTLGDVAELN